MLSYQAFPLQRPLFDFSRFIIGQLAGNKPDPNSALKDNTKALDANTAAMKLRAGTTGGGARAAGALPSRLGGYAFAEAEAGGALRLGGWTL